MNVVPVYGEGFALPAYGDYKVAKAYRLWCMGLSTEADAILWPNNRRLVVDWWKLDAKMQEKRK